MESLEELNLVWMNMHEVNEVCSFYNEFVAPKFGELFAKFDILSSYYFYFKLLVEFNQDYNIFQ